MTWQSITSYWRINTNLCPKHAFPVSTCRTQTPWNENITLPVKTCCIRVRRASMSHALPWCKRCNSITTLLKTHRCSYSFTNCIAQHVGLFCFQATLLARLRYYFTSFTFLHTILSHLSLLFHTKPISRAIFNF